MGRVKSGLKKMEMSEYVLCDRICGPGFCAMPYALRTAFTSLWKKPERGAPVALVGKMLGIVSPIEVFDVQRLIVLRAKATMIPSKKIL